MEAFWVELAKLIPSQWGLVASLAFLVLWTFFANAVRSKSDPQWIDRFLAEPRCFAFYTLLVGWVLDWIGRALTPPNVADDGLDRVRPMASDRDAARAAGASPFGWPVLDLTLRLAIAYPLLLLLANWSVLDVEGRVGTLEVLPADPPWWARAGTLLILAALTVSLVLPSRARGVVQLAALGSAFVVGFAGTGAVAVAVAFAVAGAVAMAFAVAAAVAVAFTVAGVVGTAAASAGAVAVTGAVTFAVARATRRGWGVSAHVALVAGGTCAVMLAVVDLMPSAEPVTTWLLFLGLLPLLNALFDWLSIGTTRTLLRRGTASPRLALVWGLVDLALALLLFVGLRALLLLLVHFMNIVADSNVIDLDAVFADVRDEEGSRAYWWLYATVFTTLVPTLLHASLAVSSLPALIPHGVRRAVRCCLTRAADSHFAYTGAVFGLTLITLWALVLPVLALAGLWYGLMAAFPTLGGLYLDVFQTLACRLDPAVACPPPR